MGKIMEKASIFSDVVSVVIPTYNRAKLIVRAVQSVLSQTYPEIEVIVVDDASTDETQFVIESLQQTDHRVRYLQHSTNRGSQAARNTGIKAAVGKYVAFLDSDDEWLPQKIASQIKLFSDRSKKIGAVYCGSRKISTNGETIFEYIPKYRGMILRNALENWLTDINTLLILREVLEKIRCLDEKIQAFQEWDLCIRLAQVCKIDFVPQCLTLYHQHPGQTISKNKLRNAFGYLEIIEKFRENIIHECGKSTLSKHYYTAGKYFVFAKRHDLAKLSFIKSVKSNPLNIKAIILLMCTLGKIPINFLSSVNK
jgi:glycosyltransferase involved in cell wall biosynthesis